MDKNFVNDLLVRCDESNTKVSERVILLTNDNLRTFIDLLADLALQQDAEISTLEYKLKACESILKNNEDLENEVDRLRMESGTWETEYRLTMAELQQKTEQIKKLTKQVECLSKAIFNILPL